MNILDRVEATAAKIGATITNKPASKRATITMEEALRRQKARKAATGPTGHERNVAMVKGVKVYAKRFEREGDQATATKLALLADEAEKALVEYNRNLEAAEQPVDDVVGTAARTAAKGLMKACPGAFSGEVEAAGWCIAHLPLTEARLQFDREQRSRHAAGKAAQAALKRFQLAIEQAAIIVGGDMWHLEAHIKALIQVGLD